MIEDLQKFLNRYNLLDQTSIIYETLIRDKEEDIKLNFTQQLSAAEQSIIETGVHIIIFLLKVYPKHAIDTPAYENYYKHNIGFVEIMRNDAIEKHYF